MKADFSDMVEYVVVLVSEFSKRFSLSGRQAYRYVRRFGGIQLIEENYDIMHTLSFDDAVNGLVSYCHRQGGLLQ